MIPLVAFLGAPGFTLDIGGLLVFILNVALAYYVEQDSRGLERPALGIPKQLWALAVLPTSVIGVAAYWLMNRSSLASKA